MHIEIKDNQINVQFNQQEANFIAHKAGFSEADKIATYIKDKLTKAFALEELANEAIPSVGKDFNLNKIKNVTDELKKRNSKIAPAVVNNPAEIPAEIPKPEENIKDEEPDYALAEQIGDELLADLLDKDLLKSPKKPKKDSED